MVFMMARFPEEALQVDHGATVTRGMAAVAEFLAAILGAEEAGALLLRQARLGPAGRAVLLLPGEDESGVDGVSGRVRMLRRASALAYGSLASPPGVTGLE